MIDEFDDIEFDESYTDESEWDVDYAQEADDHYPIKTKKNGFISKLISFFIVVIFLGGGMYFIYLKFWPQISTSIQASQSNVDSSVSPNKNAVSETANIDVNTAPSNNSSSDSDDISFSNQELLPPMPTPVSTDIDVDMAHNATSTNIESLTPLPELDDIDVEALPTIDDSTIASDTNDDVIEVQTTSETTVLTESKNYDGSIQKNVLENEKIMRLETTLAETNSELEDAKKTIEALKSTLKTTKAALKNAEAKAAKALSKPKKSKLSTPKTITKKPAAKPIVRKTNTQSVQWVLRAAKPGQATVAMKGTNELKSITVGNTLSGIGKITSISNASGKWVIKGSQGSISQ